MKKLTDTVYIIFKSYQKLLELSELKESSNKIAVYFFKKIIPVQIVQIKVDINPGIHIIASSLGLNGRMFFPASPATVATSLPSVASGIRIPSTTKPRLPITHIAVTIL